MTEIVIPDDTVYPSDSLPEIPEDQEQVVAPYDETIPDEESDTE